MMGIPKLSREVENGLRKIEHVNKLYQLDKLYGVVA